jgi:polysaccharide biosynthesis/export protein
MNFPLKKRFVMNTGKSRNVKPHQFVSIAMILFALLSAVFGQPSQPASDYRIRKGDKLSIKFLYQPELSDAAMVVRPDGKISLPMIDELKAEGLTVRELKITLEKAYREILLDPEITVNVVEFVAPRVFVTGQVVKPGSYDLRAGQTLFQVVTLAGGFTREAHRKQILHARPINEREMKVVVVDVTKLLKPGNNKFDIVLQDGDYVYVPESKMSKLSNILNAFRAVAPGYGIQF